MSTVAPTPTAGEWEIDRTGQYYPPCIRMNGVVVALLPDAGAHHMHPAPQRAEARANAQLLLASPKLLAALRDLWQWQGGVQELPPDELSERVTAALALAAPPSVRACRECDCTDDYCAWCIRKTGGPCHWVEADLCSACLLKPVGKAKGKKVRP